MKTEPAGVTSLGLGNARPRGAPACLAPPYQTRMTVTASVAGVRHLDVDGFRTAGVGRAI